MELLMQRYSPSLKLVGLLLVIAVVGILVYVVTSNTL